MIDRRLQELAQFASALVRLEGERWHKVLQDATGHDSRTLATLEHMRLDSKKFRRRIEQLETALTDAGITVPEFNPKESDNADT